jgi:hypothetical protein
LIRAQVEAAVTQAKVASRRSPPAAHINTQGARVATAGNAAGKARGRARARATATAEIRITPVTLFFPYRDSPGGRGARNR